MPPPMFSLATKDAEQTKRIGKRLSGLLEPGTNIGLFGELGAGKTQLVKGIARGLHIEEDEVVSPSFGLINVYEGDKKLYHVDLYRLESESEIATLGLEDYIFDEEICIIEWADRLKEDMEFLDIRIYFEIISADERILTFSGRRLDELGRTLKPLNSNKE